LKHWYRASLLFIIFLPFLLGTFTPLSTADRSPDGCLRGCGNPVPQEVESLRVVSYNLLHGFPLMRDLSQRVDVLVRELQFLDADIVLLQEVPQSRTVGDMASRLGQALEMNYVYARANGGLDSIGFEEGEAILSRFPLRDAEVIELEPRAGVFENRILLHALVETPHGDLDVFVTHLSNKGGVLSWSQSANLKLQVQRMQDGPAIIGGDFNASPDSHQVQELQAIWLDMFADQHPEQPGYTCCALNRSAGLKEGLEQRFDYLFYSPYPGRELVLVDAQLVLAQPVWSDGAWLWASDHAGVMAEFSILPVHAQAEAPDSQ